MGKIRKCNANAKDCLRNFILCIKRLKLSPLLVLYKVNKSQQCNYITANTLKPVFMFVEITQYTIDFSYAD